MCDRKKEEALHAKAEQTAGERVGAVDAKGRQICREQGGRVACKGGADLHGTQWRHWM